MPAIQFMDSDGSWADEDDTSLEYLGINGNWINEREAAVVAGQGRMLLVFMSPIKEDALIR